MLFPRRSPSPSRPPELVSSNTADLDHSALRRDTMNNHNLLLATLVVTLTVVAWSIDGWPDAALVPLAGIGGYAAGKIIDRVLSSIYGENW